MLVLSRKVGQRLVIDGNVTIIVTRIAGNRVQIGIEAPADVHIMRGELDKIRRQFSATETHPVAPVSEFDSASEFSSRPVH
ncbi:MAG: carbon storage regulator [Planctomycetota bacterium]|nr:carbon storage regulator [Planctomycetota bacterium]